MLGFTPGRYGTDYLTGAVAGGRESYYSGAVTDGEPPGRWHGAGAAHLGLTGQVDAEDLKRLYGHFVDPRDERFRTSDWQSAPTLGARPPQYASAEERMAKLLDAEPNATPERVEELKLQASKQTRSAVAFFDATLNVQKSVTVLHTAFEAQEVKARAVDDEATAAIWKAHREAVEEAIWAGNRAGLDFLEQEGGYTRVGHHGGGAGRWAETRGFTVASFFQHTNRENDPHLHIHNAILNRVECADGSFRTLDSAALRKLKPAAGAIADRVMEEHLTRTLGVRFAMRPDGKAREIVGMRQEVMDLFSTRRRQVTGKYAELAAEFERQFGRAPSNLERDRMMRTATLATRKAKSHDGETLAARLERWDRQLRAEVADGLEAVARDVLGQAGSCEAGTFSPTAVIEAALADVQSGRSTWTRADFIRSINHVLPDSLGGLPAAKVAELVTGLADAGLRVIDPDGTIPTGVQGGQTTAGGAVAVAYNVRTTELPDAFKLSNGRSAYAAPSGPRFATAGQLAAERQLREAAVLRGAFAVDQAAIGGFLADLAAEGVELAADQRAAVTGFLTGGAKVECLVGPAGTGKSFTVGVAADAWRQLACGEVYGLAASQIATEVLAGEGLDARNITRWLNSQERLAGGRGSREDEAYRIGPRDLVFVDESGMADTAALKAIVERVTEAGAKVVLTGDHRQLAAVGAGGGFALMTERAITYELSEVRRFTNGWERGASLRLREGDSRALLDYAKRGRLVTGGTLERAGDMAARAYLGDILAGKRSLLIVDGNEQAARLSSQVRAELVRLGRVGEDGVTLGMDGNRAGVGDLVQARLNARILAGHEGNRRGPVNREMYRVTATRDDGGLVVEPLDGGPGMTLPAGYVGGHLVLGYATTVHSAQGVTVDTAHSVATSRTGAPNLYVGLTRGRESNTCYVETVAADPDAPVGSANQVIQRTPTAVLADIVEQAEDDLAAIAEAEASEAESRSLRTIGDRFSDGVSVVTAGRMTALLDRLTDRGILSVTQRQAFVNDPATGTLGRLLRTAELAGHNPERAIVDAITCRELDTAANVPSVVHSRIAEALHGQLAPIGDSYAQRIPAGLPERDERYLRDLAEQADERRHELGFEAAERQPQWAVEAFGPVPDEPLERLEWERKAGIVAAHRELAEWDSESQALGPAPKLHDTEDRASWHAAWRALGRPEADREEAEMTEGQLRVRVRAYEREETWAPTYVADELAEASRAVARERTEAELARAAGRADEAADRDARARELAAKAAALELVDQARAEWYADTAATRAAAYRAREELAERNVPLDDEPDRVTAEEWLAAERAARVEDDKHREVAEADVTDEAEQTSEDRADQEQAEQGQDDEAKQSPDLDEVAEQVKRAQEALERIEARRAEEAARKAAEEAARTEEEAARRAREEQERRDQQDEEDEHEVYARFRV